MSAEAPPDPLAGFKGAASRQEGMGGIGEGRTRGTEARGERRNGEGGEKGKVGGIAPWLLGVRRPCSRVFIWREMSNTETPSGRCLSRSSDEIIRPFRAHVAARNLM